MRYVTKNDKLRISKLTTLENMSGLYSIIFIFGITSG